MECNVRQGETGSTRQAPVLAALFRWMLAAGSTGRLILLGDAASLNSARRP